MRGKHLLIGLSQLLLIFLFSPVSNAQSIASLKQQALENWRTDPDSAIRISKKIGRLANLETDHENEAWAFNMQGVVFGALGKFDSSYHYYDLSLAYCRLHGVKLIEQKTLMNLAINYQYQGRYEKSMQSFLDAIRAFEATGDTLGLGHAYSGLGGVHWYLEQENEAVNDYQKSIAYYESIGGSQYTGSVYSNLGALLRDLDQPDSARYYFNRALVMHEKVDNRIGLVNLYINIGGLYRRTDPDSALYFHHQALELAQKLDYNRGLSLANTAIAETYFTQENYLKAKQIAYTAFKLAEEIEDLEFQQRNLEVLYQSASNLGQTNSAFQYLEQYQLISDSVLNIEKQKAVTEAEAKYENEKKEKEIARQQAQAADQELKISRNEKLIVILISLALGLAMIGMFVFFYQRNLRRKAQQQLELQSSLEEARREKALGEEKLRISRELHDNIGSQITFLISSIDNLNYYQKEEKTKSKLNDLAGFARDAIADLRHTIWALNKDVSLKDLVTKTGDLAQKISSSTSLKAELKQDLQFNPELRSTVAINMLRIIQEALQNAARHAEASQVDILFISSRNEISITVRDNGKGFPIDGKESGNGFGLENQRQRAAAIGAKLEIESTPEKGSTVKLVLPIG